MSSVAVLAAVAALVLGLYLLKPPPRRMLTASNFIWEQVVRQTRQVLDRWRWWVSLMLAMLIACIIAGAMLRPPASAAGGAGRMVIVVDDSATMDTRTADGRSRFEHALSRARALIKQNSSVLLADTARVLSTPAFTDRQTALAALDKLHVSFDTRPLFPDLAQMSTEPMLVRAVFITDGVALPAPPPGVEMLSVFEPAFNLGITAFDVRPVPGDSRRAQAFVEVSNAASEAVAAEIEIAGADRHRALARVSVEANKNAAMLIDVSEFDGGPLLARVRSRADALAIDDVAYALLPMRKIVRVGLVSSGNAFLEKSLRSTPRVQLRVMQADNFDASAKVDAWIFDRFAPPAAPTQPALLLRPPRAAWLPKSIGELAHPSVTGWSAAHPLLHSVVLGDLLIDQALRYQVRQETVLLRGERDAALLFASEDRPRRVIAAFALDETNFALQPGFPIFLANTLNWLTDEPIARTHHMGAVTLPLLDARVVAIDGSELATLSVPEGTLFQPGNPGLFTAVAKDSMLRVAVNLFDPGITRVNASRLQVMRDEMPTPREGGSPTPWRWLLALALLLLLVEWRTWNRRITV